MKHDLANELMLNALNNEELAISDPPLRINGNATIVDADIETTNGIIHGISGVLAPASVSSNIVDIAKGDDRFSILVEAVMTADLGEALMGNGPLTLFGRASCHKIFSLHISCVPFLLTKPCPP